ncbi:hypothetical protein FAM18124_00007 [Lacticaseibacillus paracasei]|uniref:Bacterial mobilisation domain-containing protein n=2 Tax=Lacticaseibacillus paracasei subsp. paracasei TaxID=47714 RepID=A0A829HA36_LACPA|nr:hypothetical protein [Lacticaseibacillus paracasei]EPC32286.1 hypothetical protein Lpp22_0452 [Lacticaseibacillus paracasei subsp. paracasei Lpp22]EPC76132.1 hypothetical protein Lpp41_00765 [Lacticaseibacillus paracasei subsp. paracasei Lpp41]RND68600.1 hypothetical protein FAM18124_00007 [Lacticaseibacillus paracasei]WKZ97563.1 hypothetical protein K6K15_14005 [Lacticaseibacillus paracasei]
MTKCEPNRKRPIRKTARFTAAELAEIKRQQFEAGYNQFSAFARYRLFNSPIFNVSLIDGNAMLPRIRRVGDQLNQITHTVNLTGTVSKEQVGAVKELVGQLSKVLKEHLLQDAEFEASLARSLNPSNKK